MHKRVRNAIYWVASIAIGLFLIFVSADKHKLTFAQTSLDDASEPLVILVDNSGSMGWGDAKYSSQNQKCLPGKTPRCKIDIAKDKIRKLLTKENFKSSKIGLIEFGNWREYADHQSRCTAVKPLVQPTIGNRDKVLKALEEIKANHDGVTPISWVLSYVFNDIFKPYNLLPGNIILVTDNEPTCKEEHKFYLNDIIASFKQQGVEIKLAIITYQAEGKDKDFKDCAEKFPDICKYWPAKTIEEFYNSLEQSAHSLGYLPEVSMNKQNKTDKLVDSRCTFRSILTGALYAISALFISLLIAIVIAVVLPSFPGWLGGIIITIKQLIPSNPIHLKLLIAAIGALAAILGGLGSGLTAIPCSVDGS